MATLVGHERDLVRLVNSLIELDFDAVEAFQAAIDRLNGGSDRAKLHQFLEDHLRHISELSALVLVMGARPSDAPNAKQIVTTGKVMLAGLMGDRAILAALRSNAVDLNKAYERAARRNDLTDRLRYAIESALADERRHKEWLEQRLGTIDSRARASG
jgi:bacterioferritin (cytochrome b1)